MTDDSIGAPDVRDRMNHLLHRYPGLDPSETQEILAFLKAGAILDIGMLKGDPDTHTRIARVQRDHAAYFKPTPLQRLAVTALLVVPVLLMCGLAWYWGAK